MHVKLKLNHREIEIVSSWNLIARIRPLVRPSYATLLVAISLQMLLVQPTDEMSKQIRVGLNENPMTRDKDVEIIKEWLSKQPHLPQFDGMDTPSD